MIGRYGLCSYRQSGRGVPPLASKARGVAVVTIVMLVVIMPLPGMTILAGGNILSSLLSKCGVGQ